MGLNDLALKYGTDKNMGHHGFTQYYERHFEHLRNEEINLLEIGVKDGASLRMWRDYFYKGQIAGLDIDPACKKYKDDRIHIWIGSQQNIELLKLMGGPNDIIIDDGSHKWKDQIETFETLFPLMNKGGIYVIEDLHTSFDGKNSKYANNDITCMQYLHKMCSSLTMSRNKRNPQVEYTAIHFYRAIVFIEK